MGSFSAVNMTAKPEAHTSLLLQIETYSWMGLQSKTRVHDFDRQHATPSSGEYPRRQA